MHCGTVNHKSFKVDAKMAMKALALPLSIRAMAFSQA
jgi:hypothetical protein